MKRSAIPILIAITLAASGAYAEAPSDYRVQSDRVTSTRVDKTNAYALNDDVYTSYETYIKSLLDSGYPIPSVILHGVSRGMTASDIAYFIVLNHPEAALETYDAFVALLPSLPSWVCGTEMSPSYTASYEPCAPAPMALDTETLFDFDKSDLRSEGKPLLDQLAQSLGQYPGSNVLVIGHTDSYGTVPYNQALSERRARAIADYLKAQQVPANQIASEGRGETEPRASNDTPQGRQLNRRVEVFIEPQYGSCPGQEGPEPTVRSVAERYFSTGQQLAYRRPGPRGWYFPDWTKEERHVWASVDELIELAKTSGQNGRREQRWWYQTDSAPSLDPADPVLVGLYKRDKEIVVDAPLSRLEAIKTAGADRIAVIFMYNTDEYLPTYLFENGGSNASGGSPSDAERGLTIEKVSSTFFTVGDRVSPPREWHERDYTLKANLDEVLRMFPEIPRVEDIDPQVKAKWEKEMGSGNFGRPVLITLFSDSDEMWVDDPERVAVAGSLGFTKIPVTFLYHGFDRYSCNIPGTCLPAIANTLQVPNDYLEDSLGGIGFVPVHGLPPASPE